MTFLSFWSMSPCRAENVKSLACSQWASTLCLELRKMVVCVMDSGFVQVTKCTQLPFLCYNVNINLLYSSKDQCPSIRIRIGSHEFFWSLPTHQLASWQISVQPKWWYLIFENSQIWPLNSLPHILFASSKINIQIYYGISIFCLPYQLFFLDKPTKILVLQSSHQFH